MKEKETKYIADTYSLIVSTLCVFILLGGIILGGTFQIPVTSYSTEFNYMLMLSVWASDFVFTLFMQLLCNILKTQEQIKEKLK